MSDNRPPESLTQFDTVFRAMQLVRAAPGGKPAGSAGSDADTVGVDAGFAECVLAIDEHGRVALKGLGGMLDRAALDTLLFRAWLFGVLTFLEAGARERIRRDPHWRTAISQGRLDKARALKEERARRGREIATVDALQFGDLGWLAVRYDGWYEFFGVESKRQAKQLVKRLEVLRNGLAHGQAIVDDDWDTIVAVARSVVAIKGAEQGGG